MRTFLGFCIEKTPRKQAGLQSPRLACLCTDFVLVLPAQLLVFARKPILFREGLSKPLGKQIFALSITQMKQNSHCSGNLILTGVGLGHCQFQHQSWGLGGSVRQVHIQGLEAPFPPTFCHVVAGWYQCWGTKYSSAHQVCQERTLKHRISNGSQTSGSRMWSNVFESSLTFLPALQGSLYLREYENY